MARAATDQQTDSDKEVAGPFPVSDARPRPSPEDGQAAFMEMAKVLIRHFPHDTTDLKRLLGL